MESPDKKINRVEELIREKDLFRAENLTDTLLSKYPSDMRVLNLSARVKLLSGKVKKAKQLAEIVCMKHNCTIEAEHMLGLCHQKLGENLEAAEVYKQIINRVPGSAFAHFQLGESLKNSGKKRESLGPYQQAIKLDGDGDIASLAEEKILRLKEDIG